MVNIPDDKVREIRERADILEIIAEYVSLRKAGHNHQGLCPFHAEKTPSFSVNPDKGMFHCFGCGAGGDVFAFVMKMEGLSFPDAVKHLAGRVGIHIQEHPLSAAQQRAADEKEQMHRIVELAARSYQGLLLEGAAGELGRSYLAGRRVDKGAFGQYGLGYAPDRWDFLAGILKRNGEHLDVAEKLGLIRQRKDGGYYDLFRNRLLFTICDSQGRPVGFGGRALDDSLPKYINSPESPIYRKSELLYGLHLAKQGMRERGTALVVEGYFDHLAMHMAGQTNVVATCGTALTSGHARILKRYADRVLTLFDADKAGRKATFRAMEIFLQERIPALVVELSAGEDPDSFILKEGADAMQSCLERAVPMFDYYLRDLVGSGDTASVDGKLRVLNTLTELLRKVDDSVARDLYAREASRLLDMDEGLLRRKLGLEPQRTVPLPSAPRPAERRRQGITPEEMLISLMGKYPEVAEQVRALGVESLFGKDLLPAANVIVMQRTAGQEIDWPAVLSSVQAEEMRGRLAALAINDLHLNDLDALKAFEDCRRQLERNPLRQIKALTRELAVTPADSARYRELLIMIDALRNKKSQLL